MGLLLSKIWPKTSTKQLLDDIDKEIRDLENYRSTTEHQQKRLLGSITLYSIILYIFLWIIFYFYYFPQNYKEGLLRFIPLIFFPLLIFLFRKGLQWYFVRRLELNEIQLTELRKRKKDILEQVMETETYKVAIEILEKYDPDFIRKKYLRTEERAFLAAMGGQKPLLPGRSDSLYTELRRRQQAFRGGPSAGANMPAIMPAPTQPGAKPGPGGAVLPLPPPRLIMNKQFTTPLLPRPGMPNLPPFRPPFLQQQPSGQLSRPVLPKERGVMDKFIDYLVGEGPGNRFALICTRCHSHNGMALKEEFEYVAFRCCYCYQWNPAKKVRPSPPPLALPGTSDNKEQKDQEGGETEPKEGESEDGNMPLDDNAANEANEELLTLDDSKLLADDQPLDLEGEVMDFIDLNEQAADNSETESEQHKHDTSSKGECETSETSGKSHSSEAREGCSTTELHQTD